MFLANQTDVQSIPSNFLWQSIAKLNSSSVQFTMIRRTSSTPKPFEKKTHHSTSSTAKETPIWSRTAPSFSNFPPVDDLHPPVRSRMEDAYGERWGVFWGKHVKPGVGFGGIFGFYFSLSWESVVDIKYQVDGWYWLSSWWFQPF